MKKLLFLFLFIPLSFFSQVRDSVLVKTDIFEVMYSETLEQPLWVKYQVTCPDGKASRKGMDFYTEKGYKTSDSKDYEANEWDKGHMAPAADFGCSREMMFKTFSYLNCALQQERLNRVHWRLLEEFERSLAKKGEKVYVEIKVIFSKNPKRVSSGAAIPLAFRKTIKAGKQVYIYYFVNEVPKKATFRDYQIK